MHITVEPALTASLNALSTTVRHTRTTAILVDCAIQQIWRSNVPRAKAPVQQLLAAQREPAKFGDAKSLPPLVDVSTGVRETSP
jgi:hypothetical protein